ncbi:MAG TPA: hypothetical protein VME42_14940 [Steroidobacteraceae bacterium]|nr:hypothetical protein [Steroidobacteraceae bacterium]
MQGRRFASLFWLMGASLVVAFLPSGWALGAETFAPAPASGAPTITAEYPVEGKPDLVIGKLTVSGAGEVTFLANRSRGRLLLKAVGADGTQLGRAESLVGLGDTPIYIRSRQGLYKILIHWKT